MVDHELSPVDQRLLSLDKYDIITRNLYEVIGKNEIKKITSDRPLKIYWGRLYRTNSYWLFSTIIKNC